MDDLVIRRKIDSDDIPWNLLLMADPSKEAIQKYLDHGDVHLAFLSDELVGVYVIVQGSSEVIELKNIAVVHEHRGKGIGKKLISHAISYAKSKNALRIEVGTGNSSVLPLALYKKYGFIATGVEKDFFVKNYREKIFENGVQCVNMIRLALALK